MPRSPLAGRDDLEIPVEHPRGEFVHWAVVDIAPDVREIAAGSASDGVTKGGKRAPSGPTGSRQGLNDYTGWFAGDDSGLRGDYFGYDGPYPPPNDLRLHRYFFRLFALDVASLEVPSRFTAGDVFQAMHGHVLSEAAVMGSYSLHPGT
jgi:Raf kinase inhibitor-like YbhB/YbcL family protein